MSGETPCTCGAGGGGYGGATGGGGGIGTVPLPLRRRRTLGAPADRSSARKRGTVGGRRRGWGRRYELRWCTLVGPICPLGPPAEGQPLRQLVGLGLVFLCGVCTSADTNKETNKRIIISISVSVTANISYGSVHHSFVSFKPVRTDFHVSCMSM